MAAFGSGRKKVIVDVKLSGFPKTLFFSRKASILEHKKTKATTTAFLVINPSSLGKITKRLHKVARSTADP